MANATRVPVRVLMIWYNFLDPTGSERRIGGVETYLWNLAKLIAERGDEPILLQPASAAFERQIGCLKVIGVEPNRRRWRRDTHKDLYDAAFSRMDTKRDIIIFGADIVSVRSDYPRALSIQHGIGCDLPGRFLRGGLFGKIPWIPNALCKKYSIYRSYRYFNNCSSRVCVDYNFLNWYRMQVADTPQGNIWVIPNFVDIPTGYQPDASRHHEKSVRIIFARRFVEYRGSRLMIQAAKRLLEVFQEVEFCFAGEGPDEALIVETFQNEPRVCIQKYLPDESLRIHERCHIAVVPSLGSEGTSLSLAEAMAAGCAVVATNVGGMTNMIIDGYNGRLVNPNVDLLTHILSELIDDRKLRLKLGERAAATAAEAFSLDRWKSRWSDVLDQLQKT